jgi:type VI secretion system lysozyme-like protein
MAAHPEGHVAALLFDRLLSREEGVDGVHAPPRQMFDKQALLASIEEQLGWLLNTRVPVDYETLDARTQLGARTTIDYGLPDLTVYPIGDAEAVTRLARHLVQTIAVFEPRLRSPRVSIVPSSDRGDALVAQVSGEVRIGLMTEAAAFVFEIGVEEGSGNGS